MFTYVLQAKLIFYKPTGVLLFTCLKSKANT